ncbi:hypothetical protein [Deinococcus sp. KSM4-11]|uniref:hypothetical protein n=1 Tax=Deinococcus sp. KSM4-11 TaxID=2568654 RepID=UPI001454D3B0|nr:hypothetical protein [Deinococcus sp. KSM4-11]
MSIQAIRPVADTTRQDRLFQIFQEPWSLVEEEATPAGEVTLLRAGGRTGYRGQVDLAN